MISYTGLRYIASYVTGILSFILLACLMWAFTDWYIEAIFVWSVVGSLFIGGGMWMLTEPKKKKKQARSRKKSWTPDCVPFVTFRREEGNEQRKSA